MSVMYCVHAYRSIMALGVMRMCIQYYNHNFRWQMCTCIGILS